MDAELAAKIVAIVASTTRRAPEALRLDAALDELGIDSLDRINILFELENAFNIDIPDEEARSIQTIKDIVERMESHLHQAESKGA